MATADWTSLPSDLISRVADVFLATSDIDYYASLRAVCHNWRAATADAEPRGMDTRFRPRHWIMLDLTSDSEMVSRLFLNVATGRFLRKDLPVLQDHSHVVTSSDGLLVVEANSDDSYISVVNPFTRFVVQFFITLPSCRDISVALAGSSDPLLFIFFDRSHGTCVHWSGCIFWKEPRMRFKAEPVLHMFAAVETFEGCVYTADTAGTVAVVESSKQTRPCYTDPRPTPIVAGCWETDQVPTFLVGSAGELLLLRAPASRRMQVFRVDLVRKALEPMRSIGNRAIFLGREYCLSVDTANLPSMEANCVYYGKGILGSDYHQLFIHHLHDGKVEMITGSLPDPDLFTPRLGPISLPKYIMSRDYSYPFSFVFM